MSKKAPMYGVGPKLGEDFYERHPGLPMFFYDETSIRRELGGYGLVETIPIDEPSHIGALPFLYVVCRRNEASTRG